MVDFKSVVVRKVKRIILNQHLEELERILVRTRIQREISLHQTRHPFFITAAIRKAIMLPAIVVPSMSLLREEKPS
jgi:hypothetical protein